MTLLYSPPTGAARIPLHAAPHYQQKGSAAVAPLSELNAPVERELAGGEVHSYEFLLSAGQYFHAVVDQQGIDVVVTIFEPSGKQVAKVDRPNGSRGPEGISLISEAAGTYRLQINSLERVTATGRYALKLVEVRNAKPQDESRIVAEKAITQGEDLRAQKKAESFLQAVDKLEQALALWRALNERYEEAVALYGIGLAYRFVGENQKAISYFGRAIPLMRESRDRYGEAVIQTGIAWAYLYLGENERALNSFSQALLIRREINDRRGEALTLHGIGWVNALLDDNQKALDNFDQALAIRQSVTDRKGEALTLVGIGKIYGRLNKQKEAIKILDRALLLLREAGDLYGEADALSIIGWVYISLAEYQKALDIFHQALPLRRATMDRTGEATTLYGIAEAERQRGNLLNARTQMEAALDIIESLGTKGTSQQLRISYFASVQDYYQSYIDLLQDLHQLYPTKGYAAIALQVNERACARSLLDILMEGGVDIRQGIDHKLFDAERLLQQKLNIAAARQRQLLEGKRTDLQVTMAAGEIESLTNDYQEIQAQIRASSPRYAALTRPVPLTAADIQQQLLDKDTLLLEYALGKERSYVWAVTPTDVVSYQLPARPIIESTAQRVYELMNARNLRNASLSVEQNRERVARADAEYPVVSALLSKILLGPLEAQLGKKRLLIVTQGALQLISFAALPAPNTLTGSGKSSSPLILDHEIVYLPSASTLAVLRRETAERKPASKEIAVLADPVFNKNDERVDASALKFRQGSLQLPVRSYESLSKPNTDITADDLSEANSFQHLPRLFATRWEAKEIMSLVPQGRGRQMLDFAANRAAAINCELYEYRILHFATHALISDTHPELSAIVLSLVNEQGKPEDGYLRAHEIYNLRVQAELVVLSGCRTGLGKDARGEGLMGLTRGFMYAGAPRVVVSLWSLNDRATAELMMRFYKKMLGPEKQSPTAALRIAQVEMLKDKRWQAPYYWAAFVLRGDWR